MVNISNLFDEADSEYVESFKSRYWGKVDKSDDCWWWTASTDGSGYGKIVFNGTLLGSHRVAKFLDEQRDISEKQANHYCGNRDCVNPDHIYLGTQAENIQDTVMDGNSNLQKLSPDDVREIRQIREETGRKHQDIADDFGVCRETVGKILRGENWAHL